jgi:hypothetical protein
VLLRLVGHGGTLAAEVLMWWCAVAFAVDLEWSSPAQPAPVHDETDVFTAPIVDTGWWPSSNDPIAVRFHITPVGRVMTDIDADSELSWPDPLYQRLVAVPNTGSLLIDAEIDVEAEVQIDIFGLFTGVIDLWSRHYNMGDEVIFDGLLLDGAPTQEVVASVPGVGQTAVDFSLQVFPGLDLVAAIDVYPEVEVELYDAQVDSLIGPTAVLQHIENQWMPVPLPTSPPASLESTTTWSATMDALLNVVIEPQIELDTFLGSFQLFSLPLDVTVVDVSNRREADTVTTWHPLPLIEPAASVYDFGGVDVGQERSLDVVLNNVGDLLLEGTAHIEGDSAFEVFPENLLALGQDFDGLSITFTPDAAAAHTAELVLVSNDPSQLEVRIPLLGMGLLDEPVTTPTDPTTTPTTDPGGNGLQGGSDEDSKAKGGCGCASADAPQLLGFMALLPLVLMRRSRG